MPTRSMPPLHWHRTLLCDAPSQLVSKTLHGTHAAAAAPFPPSWESPFWQNNRYHIMMAERTCADTCLVFLAFPLFGIQMYEKLGDQVSNGERKRDGCVLPCLFWGNTDELLIRDFRSGRLRSWPFSRWSCCRFPISSSGLGK